MDDRTYIAIDLKSFYASVECVERGLNPMDTCLVVADERRTEKTICLAVTPALKAYGVSGRARLFEVVEKVKEVNAQRKLRAPGRTFSGESYSAAALVRDPGLSLSYLVAPPQMAHYMKISTEIYQIYLRYVAPEDIHVYSIDEVFIDATAYLRTYHTTPQDLARRMIQDVLSATGIIATAGIGTNLYLCKVAMDIVAKHIPPDKNGVRIAQLDEMSYREKLWTHQPITDFWRVGRGYAKKLAEKGLYTMGDIARCSLGGPKDFFNEELLYKLFGVHAELLIDHAWGYEPCTIGDIKAYRPQSSSLSTGQVLQCPYAFDKARLVVREMADLLSMDLVRKGLVTNQMTLTVGYDIENLQDPVRQKNYQGTVTTDAYGRKIPKHAHGTANLSGYTSSTREILSAVTELFDRVVNPGLLVRRMYVVASRVLPEAEIPTGPEFQQLDLFTDYAAQAQAHRQRKAAMEKEKNMQLALLSIREKYGKNAILKGMNLEDGATAKDRNGQIGGHKA